MKFDSWLDIQCLMWVCYVVVVTSQCNFVVIKYRKDEDEEDEIELWNWNEKAN